MGRAEDTGLAIIAALLLVAGAVASGIQVATLGRLTPPVLALDVIGVTLMPYGLLALYFSKQSPEDDDGGGGGGGTGPRQDGPQPAPSGGLSIDWPRFEAEFRAYAQAARLPVAPSA